MSALFSELEVVDCPLPAAREHGEKPRLEWLPLENLRIDANYQRPIMQKGRANIARIVTEFSWSRFSPLVVTPIVQGLYAIIDGQHRATAAKRLGIVEVPCQIVSVKATEAALIFSTINGNVTPMSPQYLYKAALAAKEEWAQTVDRIAKAAGVEILTYPVQLSKQKPGQTMIVGTLKSRIEKYGADLIALALEGMMKSPGAARPGFLRSLSLDEAIIRIRSTPDAFIDRAATVVALSRINYDVTTATRSVLPPAFRGGQGASIVSKPGVAAAALMIIKPDDKARILDWHKRRYTPSQIAAVSKLPYAEIMKVIEEASA